jgi:glyoxylase-like metal-dependent hydrolase (beta-lactamase superfamily II)
MTVLWSYCASSDVCHDVGMPPIPYTDGLHPLAPGTYAYLRPPGSWGQSNGGLVTAAGQAVLVDTPWTLGLTRNLLDAVDRHLPGTTITTVVNTHPNGDHCWGNQLFAGSEIVASAATAHGMSDEIGPEAMTAMILDTPAQSAVGQYMRRFFGKYDFSGIKITPPTRTFTGELTISVGDRVVHLVAVGPAHTDGDLIAHVPDAGVVFAGDILFVGDHPVMWSGPISNWIAACDRIRDMKADIIVPGHGPVTDQAGVAAFRDYLVDVHQQANWHFERRTPYQVAAARIAASGYRDWGHPERLVITVGAIYRDLGCPDPAGRLGMIEHMAQVYRDLNPEEIGSKQNGCRASA